LSSVSNASSSGIVTWTCAVSVLAGEGDALGDGLGCVETVVFELFGAGAQPAISTIKNHERIKSRRITVILQSSIQCVSWVIEQWAFQRGAAVYHVFLNDLRTMRRLARPVV
jgi:hypothetical protein